MKPNKTVKTPESEIVIQTLDQMEGKTEIIQTDTYMHMDLSPDELRQFEIERSNHILQADLRGKATSLSQKTFVSIETATIRGGEMKTVTTPATQTQPTTPAGAPKQWDAFPEPKGWSMRWDGTGLVPPQNTNPGKP